MNKQLSRIIIIGFAFLLGISPAILGQELSATSPAAKLPSAESILDRYIEVTCARRSKSEARGG